jgi:heme exporter protein CcmD
MPHLPFLLAAYAVTLVAMGGLIGWSLLRMRRAERSLDGDK